MALVEKAGIIRYSNGYQLHGYNSLLRWLACCMFAGYSLALLPCHLIAGNKEVSSMPKKVHHFGFCALVYACGCIQSLLHVMQPSLCSPVGN